MGTTGTTIKEIFMFNIKTAMFNLFFKFDLVSDLPGRMRLKVAHYKKLPKETQQYQQYGIQVIKRLDGIDKVTFNFVTGTVLIEYDKYKLTSSEILAYLDLIKKLVNDNMGLIKNLDGKSEKEIVDILFSVLDAYRSKHDFK